MPAFNYKQEYERYKKYYLSLEPTLNKPTNRAYTAIIFSFLAVSLFGWYAIRPTMQTIFTLKREIVDKTGVDKKMEDKISALIEAQANFENIQNDLPVITEALPLDPEPVRALGQLSGLASNSGVVIIGLSVPPVPLYNDPVKSKIPAAGKVNSLPITLSASGTYKNIKSFLVGITNLRRIFQITDMTFTPRQETSGTATPSAAQVPASTQVQIDLKLNVFYYTIK